MKKRIKWIYILCILCLVGVAAFQIKHNDVTSQAESKKSKEKTKKNVSVEKEETESGMVYLQADANGNLKNEDADADVPVSVKVTYYLNGKKISAKDMKGKSGTVKIRFDYTNLETMHVSVDGEESSVPVPFLMISAVMLPEDTFSNVEVSNGKVLENEDQQIAVGIAFPALDAQLDLKNNELTKEIQLPDYVEITADAEDFELDFTANIIGSLGLSEMDEDAFEDMERFTDSMEDMGKASDVLVEGVSKLVTGTKAFQKGWLSYAGGVNELKQGIQTINKSVKKTASTSNEGMKSVTDAASILGKDTKALGEELSKMGKSLAQIKDADQVATNQAKEKAKEILEEDLDSLVSDDSITEEQKNIILSKVTFDSMKLEGVMGTAVDMTQSLKLLEDMGKQLEILNSFSKNLTGMSEGMNQLAKALTTLHKGATALTKNNIQMTQGLEALVTGTSQLSIGIKTFDREGINVLEALAGDDVNHLLKCFKQLRKAEIQYKELSKDKKYVIETDAIS